MAKTLINVEVRYKNNHKLLFATLGLPPTAAQDVAQRLSVAFPEFTIQLVDRFTFELIEVNPHE